MDWDAGTDSIPFGLPATYAHIACEAPGSLDGISSGADSASFANAPSQPCLTIYMNISQYLF